MRKLKTGKKKKNRAGKICVSCIVLLLVAILSIQIVRLYRQDEDLKKQEKQSTEELQKEEDRAEELKRRQEYVGSDQYVEDTARSKLGMTYEDEIIFKEE